MPFHDLGTWNPQGLEEPHVQAGAVGIYQCRQPAGNDHHCESPEQAKGFPAANQPCFAPSQCQIGCEDAEASDKTAVRIRPQEEDDRGKP